MVIPDDSAHAERIGRVVASALPGRKHFTPDWSLLLVARLFAGKGRPWICLSGSSLWSFPRMGRRP